MYVTKKECQLKKTEEKLGIPEGLKGFQNSGDIVSLSMEKHQNVSFKWHPIVFLSFNQDQGYSMFKVMQLVLLLMYTDVHFIMLIEVTSRIPLLVSVRRKHSMSLIIMRVTLKNWMFFKYIKSSFPNYEQI